MVFSKRAVNLRFFPEAKGEGRWYQTGSQSCGGAGKRGRLEFSENVFFSKHHCVIIAGIVLPMVAFLRIVTSHTSVDCFIFVRGISGEKQWRENSASATLLNSSESEYVPACAFGDTFPDKLVCIEF